MAIYKLDGGGYVISSHRVWRPGVYESERAARYAFRFSDDELKSLQNEANENSDISERRITLERLQQHHREAKGR